MAIILVLDNIRSAYNVGSIFRTADGAGVNKIIICGYTPTPENSKVLKTSLGAEKTVEWEYHNDIRSAIISLKAQKFDVLAVEVAPGAKDYYKYDFKNNTALILGNEKLGVNEEILKLCNDIIMIDMNGRKTSLNVAVTAGIISYSVIRSLQENNK